MMICLTAFLVFSCDNEDDTPETTPPRDRGEQAIEDDQELIEFLSTHFYNYEEFENPSEDFDYVVSFDTIAGENQDKTPIIESEKLVTKSVNFQGVDQQLYVLVEREGAGEQPTFADSTLVSYQGELLNGNVFDSRLKSPTWFNLSSYVQSGPQGASIVPGPVEGFTEGLIEFRAASGFEVQSDNTIKWNNDFGVGAIFMPSGLAYFSAPQRGIPSYSPIVFAVNMYRVNEADHDRDGVASIDEDLDGDGDLFNDDTDQDGLPNFSDADDDGDGKPTKEELGDKNEDGIPDYLDPDIFE